MIFKLFSIWFLEKSNTDCTVIIYFKQYTLLLFHILFVITLIATTVHNFQYVMRNIEVGDGRCDVDHLQIFLIN